MVYDIYALVIYSTNILRASYESGTILGLSIEWLNACNTHVKCIASFGDNFKD